MPKGLRIILYVFVGFFSFIFFLYTTFPFDVLKDRLIDNIESGLKGGYEIKVGSVSPGLLGGVNLKGVRVMKKDETGSVVFWQIDNIKLRMSLLSMLFGKQVVKFDFKNGGNVSGRIDNEKNRLVINVSTANFDLGKIAYLATKYGLNFKTAIDANIALDIDPRQIVRSNGSITIEPNDIKILATKTNSETLKGILKDGEIPELTIGAGKSSIVAKLDKGQVKIETFKLEKGDVNLDLAGAIYLATTLDNLRLNLTGSFGISEKLNQLLPVLFIIEKQKNEDGTYPLSITGKITRPQIKIRDFTVPLGL